MSCQTTRSLLENEAALRKRPDISPYHRMESLIRTHVFCNRLLEQKNDEPLPPECSINFAAEYKMLKDKYATPAYPDVIIIPTATPFGLPDGLRPDTRNAYTRAYQMCGKVYNFSEKNVIAIKVTAGIIDHFGKLSAVGETFQAAFSPPLKAKIGDSLTDRNFGENPTALLTAEDQLEASRREHHGSICSASHRMDDTLFSIVRTVRLIPVEVKYGN